MPRTLLIALLSLLAAAPAAAERYAFVVGVGGYDTQLRSLGGLPRNDAVKFRDALISSGYKPDNIVLMVDDYDLQPTTGIRGRYLPWASNIRDELGLLLAGLERDDSLVIALAGHGVQFEGEKDAFFCPANAKLGDRNTLLSIQWLCDQLKYDEATGTGCKPRQKLLLVDACRNDPASGPREVRLPGGRSLASVTQPRLAPLPEGLVALFSCAPKQVANQHKPLGHGVFFHHVIEGWNGAADGDRDEVVTLDELIAYAKSRTKAYARTKLAAAQTPYQRGYFEGTWELRKLRRSEEAKRLVRLAYQANEAGKYQEAITRCDEAIRLDPKYASAYNNRGFAWMKKGDYDRAIRDYDEAIRLDPKHANAYYNRGNMWYRKRDYERAIRDYDEAIRLDPKNASIYTNRGNAWDNKGDNDRAIRDYDEAIRLDPKHANSYYNRGIAWSSKGDNDRAIWDYDEVIRLDPKYASAYNNRGFAWMKKGDYDRAIRDYDEAIRLDPDYEFAVYNRARCWEAKKEYGKAVAGYTEAIRLAPKDAVNYRSRARVLRARGDEAGAARDLAKAKEIDKGS